MVTQKLIEIKSFISSSNMDIFIYHRYLNYSYSFSLFLDHPLFGAISAPSLGPKIDVFAHGNHSHFFDTTAYYGIFVLVLQLYVYSFPIIELLRKYQIYRSTIITGYILFIILVVLNNITPSIAFAIYFVTPTMIEYYDREMQISRKTIK